MLHHPFLFKGKTNASSRSSKKNFWRRCHGDLRQVKTYQVTIISSHLLHYIILHSPLVFLPPTSKTIFEKIFPFLRPSSIRLFVCSCARFLALTHSHKKIPSCVNLPILIIMILLVLQLLPPLVRNLMKLMPLC